MSNSRSGTDKSDKFRKSKLSKLSMQKKEVSSGKVSTKSIIEELNEMESLRVEDLLRSVKTLEESLQDLPSIDDTLAGIERLSVHIKKDQEEHLNE